MSNPTIGIDAAVPNTLLENAGLDVIAESERKGFFAFYDNIGV